MAVCGCEDVADCVLVIQASIIFVMVRVNLNFCQNGPIYSICGSYYDVLVYLYSEPFVDGVKSLACLS